MTIDFKYVPPSPEALSGPAFISQTEQAFSELGQEIDTANTSASEALTTARTALTTATDAALTANDAQTLAQNAQDAADAAQATADAAGGKADEALDRANAAYDTAANAESKADAAGGAAETAQNGADTAHQRADEAYSLAEKADTTATAARSMASAAMGEYIVVPDYVPEGDENGEDPEPGESAEPEDANEYFQTAEKLYFTGQNLLNFPLEAPFYFDVHITSDGKGAFQRAFTGDEAWTRQAVIETVIDHDTGEQESKATWTEWSAAMGGVYSDTKAYELCEFYFFRSPVLRDGFQPAHGEVLDDAEELYPQAWAYLQTDEGQHLCVSESEWQAMSTASWATLADSTTVGWEGVGGVPYYVQNLETGSLRLPDLRGMYAEAAGFDDLDVGGVHGDGIRNITGRTVARVNALHPATGVYVHTGIKYPDTDVAGSGRDSWYQDFDASRIVPTAAKNQPRAWGALACVYLGGAEAEGGTNHAVTIAKEALATAHNADIKADTALEEAKAAQERADAAYELAEKASLSGGGGYELCEFYFFRNPELKPGFQPAHGEVLDGAEELYPQAWAYLQTEEGQKLCVSELEWQAMSTASWATLADGTTVGWEGVGGVPYYVQDLETGSLRLPDLRGMYAEAAGFDDLDVGDVHGDAIRNFIGILHSRNGGGAGTGNIYASGGAFVRSLSGASGSFNPNAGNVAGEITTLDPSRVVPTANKNQPRAWGALACVYLGGAEVSGNECLEAVKKAEEAAKTADAKATEAKERADAAYELAQKASLSGGGGYELCEFYFFRNPELKPGFQPAHGEVLEDAETLYPEAWAYLQTEEGQKLCVSELEWQAMSTASWATLADGTTVGWEGVGGVPYYVQDLENGSLRLPDLRGMYAEAAGFDDVGVGDVHGDAVRNIEAYANHLPTTSTAAWTSGAFAFVTQSVSNPAGTVARQVKADLHFNAERVVPTANKNQPRAWGALACVYLGSADACGAGGECLEMARKAEEAAKAADAKAVEAKERADAAYELAEKASLSGGGGYELCEFYFFRNPELKPGFQPAHGEVLEDAETLYPEAWAYLQTEEGQKLCLDESAWQAMSTASWATLADGTTVGWEGVGGVPYYVQDLETGSLRLPDLRGMYAEAAGFDDLDVGDVHGDGIRRLQGTLTDIYSFTPASSGIFGALTKGGAHTAGGSQAWGWEIPLDSSRVAPAANKNQPRAWGAQACVYLGGASASSGNECLETAKKAEEAAQEALKTANEADGKADTAQEDAKRAEEAAKAADAKAIEAQERAEAAIDRIDAAKERADAAYELAEKASLSVGGAYELCEFYFFRSPELRPGFQPAHGGLLENAATLCPEAWAYLQTEKGRKLCVTEEEWQAMTTATWAILADGSKVGWNGIGGAPYFVQNLERGTLRLPDLRGMYTEAAGFDSLGVGGVHGDAIRNITGYFYGTDTHEKGSGALADSTVGYRVHWPSSSGNDHAIGLRYFNAALVIPTGSKNAPRAWGALPCVYLGL